VRNKGGISNLNIAVLSNRELTLKYICPQEQTVKDGCDIQGKPWVEEEANVDATPCKSCRKVGGQIIKCPVGFKYAIANAALLRGNDDIPKITLIFGQAENCGVGYCSRKCQQSDDKVHRMQCSKN
jgi:hypothetical protein